MERSPESHHQAHVYHVRKVAVRLASGHKCRAIHTHKSSSVKRNRAKRGLVPIFRSERRDRFQSRKVRRSRGCCVDPTRERVDAVLSESRELVSGGGDGDGDGDGGGDRGGDGSPGGDNALALAQRAVPNGCKAETARAAN